MTWPSFCCGTESVRSQWMERSRANDTDMETMVTSSRSLVSQGTQEASVDKFRSYLLHGNKAEGLQCNTP